MYPILFLLLFIPSAQDVVGFNKAAMAYLRSNIELNTSASFYGDAQLKLAELRQKRGTKRKRTTNKKKKSQTSVPTNIIE